MAKIMADVVDFSDRTDNLPGGPGADFEKFHLRLPERHLASCAPENTQAVTGNGPALADP